MFIILVTPARPLEARFLCRDVFWGSPAMVWVNVKFYWTTSKAYEDVDDPGGRGWNHDLRQSLRTVLTVFSRWMDQHKKLPNVEAGTLLFQNIMVSFITPYRIPHLLYLHTFIWLMSMIYVMGLTWMIWVFRINKHERFNCWMWGQHASVNLQITNPGIWQDF